MTTIALLFQNKFFSKKYLIWEGVIAAILAFGLFGASILVFPFEMPLSTAKVFQFFLICVACWPISVFLFWFVDFVQQRIKKECSVVSKKKMFLYWGVYFGIAFGVPVLYLIAFNPAIMFGDSYLQVGMATGTIEMDAWQPLFDTLVIRLILAVCNCLQAVVIVQVLYWALVVASLFYFIAKGSGRWFMTGVVLFLFSIAPNQGLQVVTILKDVPFATTMLWMLLILMRLFKYRTASRVLCLEAGLCVALICLIRLNGIVVALTFLLAFIFLLPCKKRLFWGIISALAVFIPYQIAVLYMEYIPVPAGSKYIALVYDIQNVKSSGYSVPLEADAYLHGVQDQEYMELYYSADPTVGNTAIDYEFAENYTLPRFIKIYLETFFEHPIVFVRNILVRMNLFWDFTENIVQARSIGITYYEENAYQWEKFPDYGPRKENVLTGAFQWLTTVTLSWPLATIFWRTAPYVVLLFLLASFIMLRGNKKQLLLFSPLIGLFVALLLTCFCSEYRYFWPFLHYGIVFLIYPFEMVK